MGKEREEVVPLKSTLLGSKIGIKEIGCLIMGEEDRSAQAVEGCRKIVFDIEGCLWIRNNPGNLQ